MAKISIIIPVYNAEKYLEQCIQSVIDQTLTDTEIICVNDGSVDGSEKIIDSFAGKDKRIKAIHKENTGYGNSVNRGIELAAGEYIGIVESDDFITESMYGDLYALSENGKADIVKASFFDCYDEADGSITYVENHERHDMPVVNGFFNVDEYPQILRGHPSVWSAIYKRSFLIENNIRFKEVKGGGWVDNPFFFETMYAAKSIRWVPVPYYCYRKTNETSSSKGYDLRLPFERMKDNLEVTGRYAHNGEENLRVLYARALMYTTGVVSEPSYVYGEDYVRPYMQEMLGGLDQDVFFDSFDAYDIKDFLKYRSPLLTMMPKASKLLVYNWISFDNPQNIGGGVTVYCRNLIQSVLRYRPDVRVYFLSSGWTYDITRDDTYIRKTSNIFGDICRSFEIVNSPVPAPQDMLFNNPALAFKNEVLKKMFDDFLEKNGPFDNVHFNNIEGLSFDVFDLKKKHKNTRFIYSLHNYVPLCMTGFYYRRDKNVICSSSHEAGDCKKCVRKAGERIIRKEIMQRGIPQTLKKNTDLYGKYDVFRWIERLGLKNIDELTNETALYEFAVKAKKAVNDNMDLILAVSERVRDIAIKNGIDKDIIKTSYIGTKVASYQVRRSTAVKDDRFKIAFLGTDIKNTEKGYPFLLNALSKLKKDIAEKTDLVLTTTTIGQDDFIKLKTRNFHSVRIVHGYTHKELPGILKGVHLGLVPVRWEDNLPQVAIEMVSFGVPVLCSDAGGASELCRSARFKFRNGDMEDFHKKLTAFIQKPGTVKDFWRYHDGLVTLKEHFDEMSEYYGLPEPSQALVSVDDYSKLIEENTFLYNMFDADTVTGGKKHGGGTGLKKKLEEAKKLISVKDEEISRLCKDVKYLNYVISETRKSVSYKLGLAMTELPRRIKARMGK